MGQVSHPWWITAVQKSDFPLTGITGGPIHSLRTSGLPRPASPSPPADPGSAISTHWLHTGGHNLVCIVARFPFRCSAESALFVKSDFVHL
jgi:hypothetical protein